MSLVNTSVANTAQCSCANKVYRDTGLAAYNNHGVAMCQYRCRPIGDYYHFVCDDCQATCKICQHVKCKYCLTDGCCSYCGGEPVCCKDCKASHHKCKQAQEEWANRKRR